MATLYVGTSGFAYASWKPEFYPAKLPANQFLKHYAERLNCVKINYTFRRLPSASTLQSWVEATPAGFVFAVKANMRITHIQRLKNAAEVTGLFLKMIDPLRSARRLGPILFQLPPALKCDVALLRDYLALLPPEVVTADFVYFRLRKPEYTVEDVAGIRARAQELLSAGRDLYVMFKHEETPDGALNAELLLKGAG